MTLNRYFLTNAQKLVLFHRTEILEETTMTIDIGVAIALPFDATFEALQFAARTSKATEMAFVLDTKRTPHITLWQGRIPSSTIPRSLGRELEQFSRLDFGFRIAMQPQLVLRESGNVFWNVVNKEELLSVHIEACARFQPYSKGLLMEHHKKKLDDPASSEQLCATIRKYGFSFAGPLFEPHVTIGRVCDAVEAKSAIGEILSNSCNFEPEHIILGRLGDYGDIIDVQEKIAL